MEQASHTIEEHLGIIVVDGQRCEVWVRSEPDGDGNWHNALLFHRAGARAPAREVLLTGVDWHVPPGVALSRARQLAETEQTALYRRAARPRTPFV
jgi:hypothetical protein